MTDMKSMKSRRPGLSRCDDVSKGGPSPKEICDNPEAYAFDRESSAQWELFTEDPDSNPPPLENLTRIAKRDDACPEILRKLSPKSARRIGVT